MKTEKRLPRDSKRQIKSEKREEGNRWRNSENEEQRQNNAAAAEEVEKCTAGIEPAQRRQNRVGARTKFVMSRRQKLADWRDTILADETIHLDPKRNKGDQISHSQHPEKPATRPEIRWRPNVIAPERSCHSRGEAAMVRDQSVASLGNRRETGNMIVAPAHPFFRRSTSERAVNRVGGEERPAVRLDENDRARKLVPWNFRKSICYFLVGCVINFAPGDLAPTLNPTVAKMTITIPDQQRLGWQI